MYIAVWVQVVLSTARSYYKPNSTSLALVSN